MSKNKFQIANVVSISTAHFFHDVYTSFLAPLLPLLFDKFGINFFLAGSLSVIQRIPSLLNPFVGIIAERLQMRYFVILSPGITAIAMSLIGVAPHYIILIILLFISGISSTLFHVPTPVMIKRVSGKRIGKGMSFYMFGGELARSVGPLIIIAAVSLWGLEGTWRVMPMGLATSVVLFYRLKDIKISDELKKNKQYKQYKDTFTQFLPMFTWISGFTFFRGAMKSVLALYLPVFLENEGHSLWFAGGSLSVLMLAGAIGTLFSGTISDKLGRSRTLLIICLSTPVFMFLFLISDGIWTFPVLVLLGFFLVAPTPVVLAIVNGTKSPHPAFMNGIYMGLNFLLNAIALLIMSLVADIVGLRTTFFLTIFISLLAIPFIYLMDRSVKKEL
ncbi:MFS transporter [Bacteroidota bacterium]